MGRSTERRTRRRGITYSPLPSQREFHRSAARFKGYSGPIGSGKSLALCQEAIRLGYVNAGRLGFLGAPTFPMLRDATQATLLEILNREGIPYELNKAENTLVLRDCGSRILFRPVDDFERLRGTNLAWFGLDELTYAPEEAWLRLEGRLRDPKARRLCGFAVWTPKGFDWVYRRFVGEATPGYQVTLAKPYENRYLLDRVPDFYERLKASYDPLFFQQEVLGEYLSTSGGLVYYAFRRDEHVKDLTVDERRPLLWALDFNIDPMCSVVAQIVDECVRVLDEIVLKNATTADACRCFLDRHGGHAGGMVVYGDASGARRQTTGNSDYQMIAECFAERGVRLEYRVPRANPAVRDRVNVLNARLKTASGRVSLLIDRRCRELIKDLEQVQYMAGTVEIDKGRDRNRTHLSDALGYLVWQESVNRAAIGERSDPLFWL